MSGPSSAARALGALVLALVGGAAARPVHASAQIDTFLIDGKTALSDLSRATCDADSLQVQVRGSATDARYTGRLIRYPTSTTTACPSDLTDPLTQVAVEDIDVVPTSGTLDLTFDVDPRDLVGSAGCASPGTTFEGLLCLQLVLLPGDVTAVARADVPLSIDTVAPETPTIMSAVGGDASVVVTVDAPDETGLTTVVQFRTCQSDASDGGTADAGTTCDDTSWDEETSSTTRVTVTGLGAEQEVEVRALFEDAFGNRGAASAISTATTVPVASVLALYNGGANDISWNPSCASGGAVAGLPCCALLLGIVLWRRRSGRGRLSALGAGAVALVLGAGTQAHAAEPLVPGIGRSTVSLHIGSYKPNLDSEVQNGAAIFPIYRCLFDDVTVPQIGGSADLHIVDVFGSLQFSFGVDATQITGKAQPTSALATQRCTTPTDTSVELTLLQIRPGLTYRFDPLLDHFGVPLVPYARVGLIGAGYAWTRGGAFDTAGVAKGHNPLGARFGYEGAVGLMLALDFLDSLDPFVPDATRRARANEVFEHTFFFAEAACEGIDTWGQPGFVLTPVDDFLGTKWPVQWKMGVAVELF